MKKSHLKMLLVLSCTLLLGLGGCTTDYTDDDSQVLEPTDETVGPKTRSLVGAVFNEGAQVWMVPQKDPYTLENFQQAYDNLLSGNTTQPLTRSEVASIADAEPLKATHYRLKIYPKTEAEEWKIEMMEDVKVAYIPFDYVQLTKAESEKVAVSTRAQTALYPDNNPYSVTYDDLETCDGPADPVTFTLPVLYAVWPCDKPLPEDMDYEIECEVFIPSYGVEQTRSTASALNEDILQRLENEAISLALGTPVRSRPVTRSKYNTLSGCILHWDALLRKNVPQPNLKQRFQLGASFWETTTDRETGRFSIPARPIPDEASYIHLFQSPKFKITTESSTAPIATNYGTVAENWPYMSDQVNMSPDNPTVEYTINRAADFFYNGTHLIPKIYYESGIRIIAAAYVSKEYSGLFSYSTNKVAYITIPCNNRNVTNSVITAVLHELGHFVHYGKKDGNFKNFKAVHNLIKESFACYVGWYLTNKLYAALGYVDNSEEGDYNPISFNHRQFWKKTDTEAQEARYSPIFVDLSDKYNQNLRGAVYNVDNIWGVPHPVIVEVAVNSNNWNELKKALIGYIGVYYSQEEYEEFVVPYDYWFAHN